MPRYQTNVIAALTRIIAGVDWETLMKIIEGRDYIPAGKTQQESLKLLEEDDYDPAYKDLIPYVSKMTTEDHDRYYAIALLATYSMNSYDGEILDVQDFFLKKPKAFEHLPKGEGHAKLHRVVRIRPEMAIEFLKKGTLPSVTYDSNYQKVTPLFESWSPEDYASWIHSEFDANTTPIAVQLVKKIPMKDRLVYIKEAQIGRKEEDVLVKAQGVDIKDVQQWYYAVNIKPSDRKCQKKRQDNDLRCYKYQEVSKSDIQKLVGLDFPETLEDLE